MELLCIQTHSQGAVCEGCGGYTENEGSACKGAISQEYHFNYEFQGLNTNGMITCNCCEDCRWKCHDSFMQSVEDGEQDTNCP